ncbi:hypothetical protein [Pseudomonas sp. NPDC089734]|uniref:hypothetical protein n=1 Tax=Pseudomonas sp. NPDC089734 TaxID=3364469 RepID=UPI0037F33997
MNTYANSAYRGDNNESLPLPRWRSQLNRSGLSSTHIAFGHYAELDSATEITRQLECEKNRTQKKQKKLARQQDIYCDAKCWHFQRSSKIARLLDVLEMMCIAFSLMSWGVGVIYSSLEELGFIRYPTETAYFMAAILTPLVILSIGTHMDEKRLAHVIQICGFIISSSFVLWAKGSLWGNSMIQVALWLGAFLYFMAAIGFNCLFWLYDTFSKHDGSEFNRGDGMVRFKRLCQGLFVAPFEEFDPVLTTLSAGYGYTITLHHRYTDNKVCLADRMHSLGLDTANALAFWDCLQRYMDVTQPLPDLPVLEQSRHLDPVTVAHDARTQRKPRRWRDQAMNGWKTSGEKKLNQQLQRYPWQQQPCVIKARLSKELTIEAWYRRQEAKGIFATPKAEDFDYPFDFENG